MWVRTIFSGRALSDLFDIDPPGAGCHDHRAVGCPVVGYSQVNLFFNIRGFIDQHFAHGEVFNVHREDGRGYLLGFFRGPRQANSTGFAAASHQNLGFNDNAATEFFCNLFCFTCGSRYPASGDGDSESRKQLL